MSSMAATHDVRVMGVVGLAHAGSHFFHLVLPPLFPVLLTALDVGYTELGLLMTVFFAVSGLCQTPAGFLVDRHGAVPILAGGLALLGIGGILAALAPSYMLLLPTAAILGLGNSVFHPSDYAILSHHVSQPRMARAFSVHTIGGTLGWAVAPVVMAAVAAATSWRVALLMAGVAGLVLAGLVWAHRSVLDTPSHRADPEAPRGAAMTDYLRVLSSPPILFCFAFFVFQALALITLQGFMPVGLNELYGIPPVLATSAVTALMLGSAAGTVAGGIVADRTGQLHGIITLGLLAGACLILLIATVELPMPVIIAAAAFAGASQGFTTPSRDLLVRRSAPSGGSGKVFGFVYSGLDLGATTAPAIAGWLVDHGYPRGLFMMAVIGTVLTVLMASNIKPGSPRPAVQRA